MASGEGRGGPLHSADFLGMDGVIKFILCDSFVLARIIKGTVEEAEGYTLEEIRQGLDLEDDGRTVRMLSPELICRKGKIVYDVLTELRLGGRSILIGVEAQGRRSPDILWRQVVYSEGLSWYQHFVLSRGFAEMCSAYSIWIFFNPKAGNRILSSAMLLPTVFWMRTGLSPTYSTRGQGRSWMSILATICRRRTICAASWICCCHPMFLTRRRREF